RNNTGGHSGLTSNTCAGGLCIDRVQDSIRNLVTDFIRMAFSNRLRGKQMSCHNVKNSFLPVARTSEQKKSSRQAGAHSLSEASSLRYYRRIWHLTSPCRLPGFIGPIPPPLLIRYAIF